MRIHVCIHAYACTCVCVCVRVRVCVCVRARVMLKIYDGRHGCCGRSISHRCRLLNRSSGYSGRCHEDSSNGRPPRAIVCRLYLSLARLRALSLSLCLYLTLSFSLSHTQIPKIATFPGCFFLGNADVTGKLTPEDVCRH